MFIDVSRRRSPSTVKAATAVTKLLNFGLREVLDRRVRSNASRLANLLRARVSNTEDRRQCNHDVLGQRNVYACYTCHLTNPRK